MAINTQLDLFGKKHRVDAWLDIVMAKMLKYAPIPPFKKGECYRIIASEIFAEVPEMERAIRGIIKAGDVQVGLKLIEAVFRHKSFPAPDTITRRLREAREDLEKRNILHFRDNESQLPGLDDVLASVEDSRGMTDSGLESRFVVALDARFGERVPFERPGRMHDFEIDFLNREYKISVELDSFEFHGDRQSFTWDRRKARIMQLDGFIHLQFSGSELTVQGGITTALDTIAMALAQRGVHAPA